MSLYLRQIRAIVWKDLLLEARTRERVVAMGAFAVLAGVLFDYTLDTTRVRPDDVAAGLIWMTLLFGGLLGIGRTFHLEKQDAALQGVLMSPAPKDAVFLGQDPGEFPARVRDRSAGARRLHVSVRAPDRHDRVGAAAALALGALGFVALGTLFAAVSSGTRMGETLLPILVFPLLLPMVIWGGVATGRLLEGRPVTEVMGSLRLLGAFALVAVAAGSVLFRFVVED
jgi:heme exporter protein B